ncbi:MAG: solute-binding protein, partial [Sinomonas sp.]|nr:solute-binding protein [Sinomonas sp.]
MSIGAMVALIVGAVVWGPSLFGVLTTNRAAKVSTSALTAAKGTAQFTADMLPSSPGDGPCTRLNVLASLENADMLSAAADAYNGKARNAGGKCVDVKVTERKSGLAADDAARGFVGLPSDQQPAVWVPDSRSWLAAARAAGGQDLIPDHGTTVASTAVGLAMPEAMAQALGWDAKAPSWDTVFKTAADPRGWERAGKPEWGYFRLIKANPTMATSGLFALASEYSAAAGTGRDLATADLKSTFATTQVRLGELATAGYMTTPGHALSATHDAADVTAVSASLSAMITDERSVWEYNRGITSPDGLTKASGTPPKVPLRMYYPSDGVYTADSTAVVVTGPWVGDAQKAAADDFIRYLRSEKAQTAVRASGFRDIRTEADNAVIDAGKLGAAGRTLSELSPDLTSALQAAFPSVRKPARVLVDLDLSGSMGNEISPGVTKIR